MSPVGTDSTPSLESPEYLHSPSPPKREPTPIRLPFRFSANPSPIASEIMGRGGTRPYRLEDGALRVFTPRCTQPPFGSTKKSENDGPD